MCYCCCSLHRYQVNLIGYGCVSFGLITTGFVFTVLAIFYKDTQIGKVWLAGPTTMVVGFVLCGKVVIDWEPATLHARQGSLESVFMDPNENFIASQVLVPNDDSAYGEYPMYQNPNVSKAGGIINDRILTQGSMSSTVQHCMKHPRIRHYDGNIDKEEAIDCIVYEESFNSQQTAPLPHHQCSGVYQQLYSPNVSHSHTLLQSNYRNCAMDPSQSSLKPIPKKNSMYKIDESYDSSPHLSHMNQSRVTSPLQAIQINIHNDDHHYPDLSRQQSPLMHQSNQPIVDVHLPSIQIYNTAPPQALVDVKCECGNVVLYSRCRQQRQQSQTPPSPSYDFKNVQRSAYQGETFVLNEKNYFI